MRRQPTWHEGVHRERRFLHHVAGTDELGDEGTREEKFSLLACSQRSVSPGSFLFMVGGSAVLVFGLVWLWVLAMPLAFLDPEYPAWLAKQTLLADCDLGDIIILGDSRAATAMMSAHWNVAATNLAVGGGEPVEALAALNRAMRCPAPPVRVILSFDAVHFTEPDLFWERTVRFGFVDSGEVAALRAVSYALNDLSVYDRHLSDGLPAWSRDAMYRIRFPSLYFSSLLKGGLFLRWPRNHAMLAATLASRGQYYFGTAAGSGVIAAEGHLREFRPLPVLEWYFNRLLEQLDARGIPAVFIAVPMNEATARQVPPSVRSAYRAWLATFEARYPGFRVEGEVMPHWPDAFFGDGYAHLNPNGATRFSTGLGRCLGEDEATAACVQRLQAAPPNTQNDAQ